MREGLLLTTNSRKQQLLQALYMSCTALLLVVAVMAILTSAAYADDLGDTINTMANNIYALVRKIGTPVAGASIAVALLMTMFSHEQKHIDVTRAIAKGIVITYVILMLLGNIMNWVSGTFLTDGITQDQKFNSGTSSSSSSVEPETQG